MLQAEDGATIPALGDTTEAYRGTRFGWPADGRLPHTIAWPTLAPEARSYPVWQGFKYAYGKTFSSSQEEEEHAIVFLDALRFIKEHNIDYQKGIVKFRLRANKFADLTMEQFVSRYGAGQYPTLYKSRPLGWEPGYIDELSYAPILHFDWRTWMNFHNIDRGFTHRDYAYAALIVVEKALRRAHGREYELSVQDVVDDLGECSTSKAVFKLLSARGVAFESDVEQRRGRNSSRRLVDRLFIDGSVTEKNTICQDRLQKIIFSAGPAATNINTMNPWFPLYETGVYHDMAQNRYAPDASFVIVGYGKSRILHRDYFILQNTLGTAWGEGGYIRVDALNTTGLYDDVTYFPKRAIRATLVKATEQEELRRGCAHRRSSL